MVRAHHLDIPIGPQPGETPPQEYAALDVDGSLVRDSIFVAVIDTAVRMSVLPPIDRGPYLGKEQAYLSFLPQLLMDQPADLFEPVLAQMDAQFKDMTYPFVEGLLEAARRHGLQTVLVSQSPQVFVGAYGRWLGADRAYGSDLVVKNEQFTGEVLPLINKLGALVGLATEGYSRFPYMAVGNSRYDLGVLQTARFPLGVGFGENLPDDIHFTVHERGLSGKIPIISVNHEGVIERCVGQLGPTACKLAVISQSQLEELVGL